MRTEQRYWNKNTKWSSEGSQLGEKADVVFIFGETSLIKDGKLINHLKELYPKAHQFGCSTAGEIYENSILDDSISVVAVQFENTKIQSASVRLKNIEDSFNAGQKLASSIDPNNLSHVLVLSPGLNVNGCELVKGMTSVLPSNVALTGGLAGDKENFVETFVVSDGMPANDTVAAIGFYGKNIKIGYASLGGWDPFGPERLITKSKGNVLYELDGKSALKLYKDYLGDRAKDLPGSAQYFPLSIRVNETDHGIVRSILTVDEKEQSMISAGDLPEGAYVRLMKTNFDRLIEGAEGAAVNSSTSKPELALLISCVGRRIVLKQRAVEEIESVRKIFGEKTVLMGFYSYGEISPFTPNAKCELHNQTMTITTISETYGKVS